MTRVIDSFFGSYRFLSNFAPAPVILDGASYPTVEHAYQAAKTVHPSERERVKYASTPGEAKRLGKIVTLRRDWETTKKDVMWDLLKQKFVGSLADQLLKTGEQELVEGNTWHDTYWGRCYCAKHRGAGENVLGKLLMELRASLRST